MKSPKKNIFKNIMTSRIFVLLICIAIITINTTAQTRNGFADLSSKSNSSKSLLAPTPITLSGNPSCATLNASSNPAFAHITSDNELRLNFEPPTGNSGPYPFTAGGGRELTGPADSNSSVSLQNVNPSVDTFDFTSMKIITAVIVKGGSNSNVYPYPTGTQGDTGLTTPDAGPAVSHISFCFAATSSITIIKEVATPSGSSATDFSFTATNLNPPGFTLDDDADPTLQDRITFNNVTPGVKTVTETDPFGTGFQLLGATCDETGGIDNSTFDFASRTVTINAEAGETITCTFTNGLLSLTAATAMVSGRVMDSNGRALSKVRVFITDSNGVARQAITNPFGYYRFEDLPSGETYIIQGFHKRYSFAPVVVSLSEDVSAPTLVAEQMFSK